MSFWSASTALRYRRDDVDRLPSAVFFEKESLPEDDGVAETDDWFPDLPHYQDEPQSAQSYRCLPLLGVSIHVDVHQTTSRTTLKQSFRNASTKPVAEAIYSFPLYDGCAIVGFKAEIGNERLLKGQVKAKPEAREIYDREVADQKAAALLEQHTPEVFEARLGHIPAQTIVDVEIVYVHELQVDISGEGLSLTIPTSVAPRYGAPPPEYSASTSHDGLSGLKITVDIHLTGPVRKLESTTHPISVETGLDAGPTTTSTFRGLAAEPDPAESQMRHARAQLTESNAVLGRDFVLLIFATNKTLLQSQAILEPPTTRDGSAAMMVSIFPRELLSPSLADRVFKGEILFLADRSGSMGSKVDSLRKAMTLFLKSLPHTCRFNVCSFGTSFSALWPQSRPWTEENLDAAINHVRQDFHANMGGTEVLAAVKNVIQSRTLHGVDSTQVIVVTDGEAWAADEVTSVISDATRETEAPIRFFALGLGDRVSHRLIQGIANAGGGFAQVVAMTNQSPLNKTIMGMLKGALLPASWDCEISFEGAEIDNSVDPAQLQSKSASSGMEIDNSGPSCPPCELPRLIRAPYQCLSLHPFARQSFFYLFDSSFQRYPESVTITMKHPSSHMTTSKLPVLRKSSGPSTMHELAAKAIMLDLENGRSWLDHDPPSNSGVEAVPVQLKPQRAAEEVGTRYGIVGKWTTYVAVDWSSQECLAARVYKAKRTDARMLTTARVKAHSSRPSGRVRSHGLEDEILPSRRYKSGSAPKRKVKSTGNPRAPSPPRVSPLLASSLSQMDTPWPALPQSLMLAGQASPDVTYETRAWDSMNYGTSDCDLRNFRYHCNSLERPVQSVVTRTEQDTEEDTEEDPANKTAVETEAATSGDNPSTCTRESFSFGSVEPRSKTRRGTGSSFQRTSATEVRKAQRPGTLQMGSPQASAPDQSAARRQYAPFRPIPVSAQGYSHQSDVYSICHNSPPVYQSSSSPPAAGRFPGFNGRPAPAEQLGVTLDDFVQAQQGLGAFVFTDHFRQKLITESKFKDYDRVEAEIHAACTNVERSTKVSPAAIVDTVVAVLYLTNRCPEQEDEWEFIVQNALKWLNQYGIGDGKMQEFAKLLAT